MVADSAKSFFQHRVYY